MRWVFGDFTFDAGARTLTREGHAIHLTPKAFQLLELLLERRPNAVAKTELTEVLWPSTFVAEGNLASLVSEARTALGEDASSARFIRTVHRHGYAFAEAAVKVGGTDRAEESPLRLHSKLGVFVLGQGETYIGRDLPDGISLDAPSVSRRHARVLVRGAEVLLEDLSSKNGTFVGDRRIREATPIREGDEIRIGAVRMTVRGQSEATATLAS